MYLLPMARHENVVVQELDKESLIYDLVTDKAFALNETSTIVYQACDGSTSFDELKKQTGYTDDLIYFALDGLNKENLLEAGTYQSPLARLSRRQIIKRIGLASTVALPVVAGIIAPAAVNAQSCRVPGGAPPGSAAACGIFNPDPSCPINAGNFCCTGTATLQSASPSTYPICNGFMQPTVFACICN